MGYGERGEKETDRKRQKEREERERKARITNECPELTLVICIISVLSF